MTVLDLREGESAARQVTAQVCVIGGGMAGLVTARRLAAQGKTVVVLESGGATAEPGPQELNEVETPSTPFTSATDGRVRGLGGSSMRWGGRFLPLAASDHASRPYLGLEAWPLDLERLARYRTEIEQLFRLAATSYEEEALDGLDRRGALPRGDQELVVRLAKWAPYNRCNIGNVLRSELERSELIAVHLHATVRDFAFDADGGRLSAVTAVAPGGARVVVSAQEFVFTASTIDTTRLLLNLDAQTDGQAFRGCRALGRYLQDHLGVAVATLRPRDSWANRAFGYRFEGPCRRSVHLELSPAAQADRGVASAFAHVMMVPTAGSPTETIKRLLRGRQSGERPSARELLRLVGGVDELAVGIAWRGLRKQHHWSRELGHELNVWIEQVPDERSRIGLSDRRDASGLPRALVDWRVSDVEERTFRGAIDAVRSYWHRHGLDRACPLDWAPGVLEPEAPLTPSATQTFHPSGTTRMGHDDVTSVVRPDLRLHRVVNASVASASVFPTAGSAGPTFTLLHLAMYAADTIARRLDGVGAVAPTARTSPSRR